MAVSKFETPFEAYRKFRSELASKSFATQLEAFADKVRETSKHVQPTGTRKSSAERIPLVGASHARKLRKAFPRQNVFFVKTAPYTSGQPNPENAIHTAGTAKGAFFNVEEFGDPSRGRLSVGVSAGITRDADWTGNTYYSELPDRWLLGDAISSSASLIQVINISEPFKVGTTLHGDVQFGWNPMYLGKSLGTEELLYDAIYNTPGLSNSALGGFVGVSAMAELTVSLVSESEVVNSGQAFNNFLLLGIDAEFYGNRVLDKVAAPYLFLDFAFIGNPWHMFHLQASTHFVKSARQLIIETTVRLVGLRGGVNDPNAGYVTAAFMDIYEGASLVSYVPSAPNPFTVSQITAFSTSF